MWYYYIYGLQIESEIPLELIDEDRKMDTIDLVIRNENFTELKKTLAKQDGIYYKESGYHETIVYYKGTCFYKMMNGNCILIDRDQQANPLAVSTFIIGPVLGEILVQRNILTLHGSAVSLNNDTYIISGFSGSGKSTVALEFLKHGYHFLSDDIVPIKSVNHQFMAIPSYPLQKICYDAAIKNKIDLENSILINKERRKYAIRRHNIYCDKPKAIDVLVSLSIYSGNQILVNEVQNTQKIELLIKNLYCYGKYQRQSMKPELFVQCLEICKKTRIIEVSRPEKGCSPEDVYQQIQDIRNKMS